MCIQQKQYKKKAGIIGGKLAGGSARGVSDPNPDQQYLWDSFYEGGMGTTQSPQCKAFWVSI